MHPIPRPRLAIFTGAAVRRRRRDLLPGQPRHRGRLDGDDPGHRDEHDVLRPDDRVPARLSARADRRARPDGPDLDQPDQLHRPVRLARLGQADRADPARRCSPSSACTACGWCASLATLGPAERGGRPVARSRRPGSTCPVRRSRRSSARSAWPWSSSGSSSEAHPADRPDRARPGPALLAARGDARLRPRRADRGQPAGGDPRRAASRRPHARAIVPADPGRAVDDGHRLRPGLRRTAPGRPGFLMLAATLLGWLHDARTEYSLVVEADRTGHPRNAPAPHYPSGTLTFFAVVVIAALLVNYEIIPPADSDGGTAQQPAAARRPAGRRRRRRPAQRRRPPTSRSSPTTSSTRRPRPARRPASRSRSRSTTRTPALPTTSRSTPAAPAASRSSWARS